MNAASPRTQLLDTQLAEEAAKIRKFQIVYGPWWPHYVAPYELRWTLFSERSSCPYCSGVLELPPADLPEPGSALLWPHIDHMDPLARGGEESMRNAVYACSTCNLAKGRRLFVDWLRMLPEANQAAAREIYTAKHGHAPEMFEPGPKRLRMTLPRVDVGFEESVLRRLYPKPIVKGPPRLVGHVSPPTRFP